MIRLFGPQDTQNPNKTTIAPEFRTCMFVFGAGAVVLGVVFWQVLAFFAFVVYAGVFNSVATLTLRSDTPFYNTSAWEARPAAASDRFNSVLVLTTGGHRKRNKRSY